MWRVSGTMEISMYVDVEASSAEEARTLAEEAPVVSLCHQCATGDGPGTWNTSGELDGLPEFIDSDITELKRGRK